MGALRRAARETLAGLPGAYWWLWTSTLINRLGGFVVTFLALYLTLERGFSASYAGLVVALYGVGGSVAAVVGGVLADRVGRRVTLLGAQLGTVVTTTALGFVTQPAAIAVTACAVGLTSNASRPAVSAMMADLVRPEDRVRAFSLNYWAINLGFGVSAAVAGLIAAHGYVWLFLADAATTLLCAVVVFVRVPETRPAEARKAGVKEPEAGLGRVLRDGRFMGLVAATFLLATVAQQGGTTLSVDMGRSGYDATTYGLVIGVNGLLIVLLQIPVTRLVRGRGEAGLLAGGSLLLAWGFGLTAFADSPWLYVLSVVVWTLGEVVHAPAAMAAVAELSPPEARGRYQGMYSLAWSAASFAGPVAGGVGLDHLGSAAVWGACAAVGTVAAAGYWALLRRPAGGRAVAKAPAAVAPVTEAAPGSGA